MIAPYSGTYQIRILFIGSPVQIGYRLRGRLLAVSRIPGQDQDNLIISLLKRTFIRNRIRQSSVQIGNPVYIHDRGYQRHAAGGPAQFHKSVSVALFLHIFCPSSLTVRSHDLALHLRGKIGFKVKGKQFIGILVKYHIHI